MKTSTLLIALVVGFLTTSVSAQETLWFDANWNPTAKEKATYYRPAPKVQGNGFWIVDYYMNGTIQMEGFSLNNNPNNEKFHGLVKYYFDDGKLYQEINYKKGEIHGIRKVYFKSGKLKSVKNYIDNKIEGKYKEYYESGELFMVGKYENGLQKGIWKSYYQNGKIREKGKYNKGRKTGVWKVYYKNVYKK